MSTVETPETTAGPQKVCPHCSAINQTTSKRCPSCGKKYKKRTVLKVFAWMSGLGLLFLILLIVLIGSAANEVSKSLDAEQNRHAITKAKFDSFKLGQTERSVIASAGKQPEDKQEFQNESFVSKEPANSSCIYYNRKGGEFGDTFQLCFDEGRLRSKNAY